MKNMLTANRSSESAFSTLLPASLVALDALETFTVVPVKHDGTVVEDAVTTLHVEKKKNTAKEAKNKLKAMSASGYVDPPGVQRKAGVTLK